MERRDTLNCGDGMQSVAGAAARTGRHKFQMSLAAPTPAHTPAPRVQAQQRSHPLPLPLLLLQAATPAGPCAAQQPQQWRRELNRLDHPTKFLSDTFMPRNMLPTPPVHRPNTIILFDQTSTLRRIHPHVQSGA